MFADAIIDADYSGPGHKGDYAHKAMNITWINELSESIYD